MKRTFTVMVRGYEYYTFNSNRKAERYVKQLMTAKDEIDRVDFEDIEIVERQIF